jgi:hypothetical protein
LVPILTIAWGIPIESELIGSGIDHKSIIIGSTGSYSEVFGDVAQSICERVGEVILSIQAERTADFRNNRERKAIILLL